jgi:hypothetical protein
MTKISFAIAAIATTVVVTTSVAQAYNYDGENTLTTMSKTESKARAAHEFFVAGLRQKTKQEMRPGVHKFRPSQEYRRLKRQLENRPSFNGRGPSNRHRVRKRSIRRSK